MSELSSQITISLQPELLQFLNTVAARECRSVAGQIRFYCEAARRAGAGAPTQVLQPLPAHENITDAASLERAKKRLRWLQRVKGANWLDESTWLEREIKQFENAMKVNGAKR